MMSLALSSLLSVVSLVAPVQEEAGSEAREIPRVLFFTHSAGSVHEVVRRPSPEELSLAETQLVKAASGKLDVVASQDCGMIRRDVLDGFDAAVFYTSGELPIAPENLRGLIDWIHEGGAFVGVHSATDTLYELAPYMELVGGKFGGHPWHEEVKITVEDDAHPATAHLGESFTITDEIYQFPDLRRHPVRVLLSLDPASVDITLGARQDDDYAIAWCRDWGRGRMFYTALGHREEVWKDPRFFEHLIGGILWAIDGPDYSPPPPPGAIVLFDGTDLSAWTHRKGGGDAKWKLLDGAMEVVPGTSDLLSREEFADGLYHVEFLVPLMPDALGQGRGNSGVYAMGRYEVQILDSFGLEQGMGDCGSVYGQRIADLNACRKPGRWQTYDIEFRGPRFDDAGAKTANARMKVWHNGRLIHPEFEVTGTTTAGLPGPELTLAPLLLQDHGNQVRYRNVWVVSRR